MKEGCKRVSHLRYGLNIELCSNYVVRGACPPVVREIGEHCASFNMYENPSSRVNSGQSMF